MASTFAQDLIDLLPRLRRFATSLTGSWEDGDDLVQAACERALRARDQWQEGTRLDAWMFQIIRNLRIDVVRKRRTEGYQDEISAAQDAVGEDGVRATEATLMLGSVQNRMATLSIEQREVLICVCVEDRSYGEAAEALGIPIGTVMSRLARARRRLAEDMGLMPDGVAPSRTG
ncbi:RNA polymerase sigma factor [Methylobacterium sp. J-092]|nr:RNA polymerase sigma factor [Methylobacterium sp. J-092]